MKHARRPQGYRGQKAEGRRSGNDHQRCRVQLEGYEGKRPTAANLPYACEERPLSVAALPFIS